MPSDARPALVCEPDAMTPEWWTAVLRASGDLALDRRVVSREHEPLGTGQVGRNLRFRLHYDGEAPGAPATLVAKLPSTDPASRRAALQMRTYINEVRFYDRLRGTVGIRTPACVFAAIDGEGPDFALVLEDLAPGRAADQIAGCSPEQARLALDELARLHGPWWQRPELAELDWLAPWTADQARGVEQLYRALVVGFRARFGPKLSPDTLALCDAFGERVAAWLAGPGGPRTLAHGDYRADNMVFAAAEGGAPIAVVDWQTTRIGCGVADAAYFLGGSVAPEVRRRDERALLESYHEALCREGVDDFAWDACWHAYRWYALGGILMTVVASMLVGENARGNAMFATMAERHAAHALDHDALSLV